MPFVAKPQKGLLTYHSSPVYGALREGTAYLKQTGFIKVDEQIEFGSADKELKGTENHLQRKVYRLDLLSQVKCWQTPGQMSISSS